MASRRRKQQSEPIRKSFLIVGGIAIGVALITFVLMTFVLGGGGGGGSALPSTPPAAITQPTPAPTPTPSPGLQPGGRDPFSPRG